VLDLVPLALQGGSRGLSSSQALRNSLVLAQIADNLGYTRYWFAEHHNMPSIASTTPEILIALAAEKTRRIHVGSGGVMLPNHSSLKVAETFKMLEALHPGRIDLGIGRAPGTDPAAARELRGARATAGADQFLEQLVSLLDYGTRRDRLPEPSERTSGTASGAVHAIPMDVSLPPIWLLGSSDFSAHMAARLGMGYGFAAHFSEFPPEGPLRAYRAGFSPSGAYPRPHAILTLSVICAPTNAEAERVASSLFVVFARMRTGQPPLFLPPDEALHYEFSPLETSVLETIRERHIVGSPETVKPRVEALARSTEADEVMVSTFVYEHADRVRSYRLLAEAFAPPMSGPA
jgi:luciferase family oxidoreductase group 1